MLRLLHGTADCEANLATTSTLFFPPYELVLLLMLWLVSHLFKVLIKNPTNGRRSVVELSVSSCTLFDFSVRGKQGSMIISQVADWGTGRRSANWTGAISNSELNPAQSLKPRMRLSPKSTIEQLSPTSLRLFRYKAFLWNGGKEGKQGKKRLSFSSLGHNTLRGTSWYRQQGQFHFMCGQPGDNMCFCTDVNRIEENNTECLY